MNTNKSKAVHHQEGNVYSCVFGRESAAPGRPGRVRSVVTDIRSEVAEINMLVREIAGI